MGQQLCCISLDSQPVDVQCPLTSSLGEFHAVVLAHVSWATVLVSNCPSPFPFSPSISRCFSIHSSPAIEFHSCFFFTADVSAPIRSTFHLLTF